ncbi:MAG: hypothetical protein ABSC18_00905 [Verrucomicrobiota bacterium]
MELIEGSISLSRQSRRRRMFILFAANRAGAPQEQLELCEAGRAMRQAQWLPEFPRDPALMSL